VAHHKSALKRIRSSERKRERNLKFRSRAKTHIKNARTHMAQGDLAAARREAENAVKVLDKAASKGILHPKNVARRKSRLMQRLVAMETAQGN
jgi:small subunit ribosomal protein S20